LAESRKGSGNANAIIFESVLYFDKKP